MSSPSNPSLCFWDVPAALLGFAAAAALSSIPVIGDYGVVWFGAPFALVVLRRMLLPMLTPPLDAQSAPISLARRSLAYIFMIAGGVLALISGTVFYFAATDSKQAEFAWPFLVALGVGGTISALGVRWITTP